MIATHKELLELKFWIEEHAREGYTAEREKLLLYMQAFGLPASLPRLGEDGVHVLEIGTGPYWGLLQFMRFVDLYPGRICERRWCPERLVAVDPLLDVFGLAGILEDRGGIFAVSQPFESFDTGWQFDAIITTNALDHGEMGFYLLPKIWRLLKPGGKLFLHVQLRPQSELNLIHDHALTRAQLDKHLGYTTLVEEWVREYPADVDGKDHTAICGVWRKP